MTNYTIITSNFKFSLTGFVRTIENNGGFPIVKYNVPPLPISGGSPSSIRWTQLTKNPTTGLAVSKSHFCKQTAEILVIGNTIHFSDILEGVSFSDLEPFINLIPSF